MIREQSPLDNLGASLASPQFTPRPGWGGQLRKWLSKNLSVIFFRLVILGALILIGRSLWMQLPVGESGIATPSVSETPLASDVITILVQPGEGMSHLAAHAINLYILSGEGATPMLDVAQHLYAVNSLATIIGRRPLETDEVLSFDTATIESVILAARGLTDVQKTAWAKLLRR